MLLHFLNVQIKTEIRSCVHYAHTLWFNKNPSRYQEHGGSPTWMFPKSPLQLTDLKKKKKNPNL